MPLRFVFRSKWRYNTNLHEITHTLTSGFQDLDLIELQTVAPRVEMEVVWE